MGHHISAHCHTHDPGVPVNPRAGKLKNKDLQNTSKGSDCMSQQPGYGEIGQMLSASSCRRTRGRQPQAPVPCHGKNSDLQPGEHRIEISWDVKKTGVADMVIFEALFQKMASQDADNHVSPSSKARGNAELLMISSRSQGCMPRLSKRKRKRKLGRRPLLELLRR